ncbi:hypothetical protein BJ970_002939 [Saccharopolyspora phatthalungensis]|uniref:Uncharacterized protein n=1 Tax=Saccharopolyspora phatthalungensis TaxID=664693 RepID=A0A840QAE8_9PSEU|nr:hypothetical protein [Saccharopolyspora phatthalungensis]
MCRGCPSCGKIVPHRLTERVALINVLAMLRLHNILVLPWRVDA